MALKLIPKIPAPPAEKRRQRLRAIKPASMLQCRCGCREVIELKSGVLFKDGRPTGGTKQFLCASCWMKGERQVLA